MCSLNWADIYGEICEGLPGAQQIHGAMLNAYQAADAFLTLEPSMNMPGLANALSIGPVASLRRSTRSELLAKLHLADDARLVTVSMGGIAMELSWARWPRVQGVMWIMPGDIETTRSDMVSVSALGKPFLDVMCSSDALITKPGYGAFVEAACNGIPVVYVPRVDWPEAPFLARWLHEQGKCREIQYEKLFGDRLGEALHAVWELPRREPIVPHGVTEAVDVLVKYFAKNTRSSDVEHTK
jgi:UDP:flavonoid glycosyltransferase YjiC (YdhE family)